MNRKFKFRVWDKTSQWVEWGSFTHNTCIGINEIFEQKCYIFQQFTGFLDKNGKEIYEGDIVNFSTKGQAHGPEAELWENQEVYFDEVCGEWTFGRRYTFTILDGINEKTFEVVGNIFENSEFNKS